MITPVSIEAVTFAVSVTYHSTSKKQLEPPANAMTTAFHTRLYSRFIEINSNFGRNKFHRTNQGSLVAVLTMKAI